MTNWIKFKTVSIVRWFKRKNLLSIVESHNNELFVGGRTSLTDRIRLGRNPNFNGMIINDYGKCHFGDNFHSGISCQIITSIHNYKGAFLPFTFIKSNRIYPFFKFIFLKKLWLY